MEELLKVNLQWFAEEEEGEGSSEEKGDEEDQKKKQELEELQVDGLSEPELKELVKKLDGHLKMANQKSHELLKEIMEKKKKFKEIDAEKDKLRQKEMEEKEEFKKLYTEIKPRYDVLEKDVGLTHEHFEKELGELKGQLPEEYKGLVPEGTDVRNQVIWIRNFLDVMATSKGKVEPEKKANVGTGGVKTPKGSGSDTAKKTITEQIRLTKNAAELEKLLTQYGRTEKVE